MCESILYSVTASFKFVPSTDEMPASGTSGSQDNTIDLTHDQEGEHSRGLHFSEHSHASETSHSALNLSPKPKEKISNDGITQLMQSHFSFYSQ